MTDAEDRAEAPLDPATERVRRKMVRLLAVSVGIMLIGVMAVLAAVVYRTTETTQSALEAGASVTIRLPAGAEILETSLDGDRFLIRISTGEGPQELLVVERETGTIASRHPLLGP